MKKIEIEKTSRFSFSPIHLVVCCLLLLNFCAFRWFSSIEKEKIARTIEGVLRNEYAAANSYALSKAITDLESLNILRCAVLTEKLDIERVYHNTALNSSCRLPSFIERFLTREVNLQAVNGLVYHLKFQLPIRWESILLEITFNVLIGLLALLYQRHVREQSVKQAVAEALFNLSRQVSHDIRSPLSALNMVVSTLTDLPEEKQMVIKSALGRINDIANQLLKKSKNADIREIRNFAAAEEKTATETTSISSVITSIITEKQIQFRERKNFLIESDLSKGEGLFTAMGESELARVLSNLINNSIEALGKEGRIFIGLHSEMNYAYITIQDNGVGIPAEILSRLGEAGFSYGKEGTQSGSGLGIYHAKKAVGEVGGNLRIESVVGRGTTVTIELPIVRSREIKRAQER